MYVQYTYNIHRYSSMRFKEAVPKKLFLFVRMPRNSMLKKLTSKFFQGPKDPTCRISLYNARNFGRALL